MHVQKSRFIEIDRFLSKNGHEDITFPQKRANLIAGMIAKRAPFLANSKEPIGHTDQRSHQGKMSLAGLAVFWFVDEEAIYVPCSTSKLFTSIILPL